MTDRHAVLPVVVVFTGKKSDEISLQAFTLSESTAFAAEKGLNAVWDETKALIKSSGAKLSELSPNTFLAVTSLPSLPPSLSLVQIPGGNYIEWFPQLYLNITLRRLGLGGRSSLSLTAPSPAQQLHFRQAFRLPIPAVTLSSSSTQLSHHHHHKNDDQLQKQQSFGECVLELIRLVQHALSLFGWGAVGVGRNEMVEDEFKLDNGDGLLCDDTLSSLSLFRVDVAEPLLHLSPTDSGLFLSPGLLAALLSIVLGSRLKLTGLGQNDVPKDPFQRRAKFLRAVNSFQTSHRLPVTPYLNFAFLTSLSTMYHRSILSEHTSTSSKVSRALKSPLPGSIISKASVNEGSVRDGAGEEVETDSLESLVETLFRLYSLSHGIVGRIWGVRTEGRKRIRIGRKYSDIDESELSVAGTGFGNSARQVLRGVKERVKRVGGVGEGQEIHTPSTLQLRGASWSDKDKEKMRHSDGLLKASPSVLVSEPSSSSLRSEGKAKGSSPEASIHPKASSFAARLSQALTSDREKDSEDTRPQRSPRSRIVTTPLPSASPPPLSATSSPRGHSATSSFGLGPPPPSISRKSSASRRSISEQHSASSPRSRKAGDKELTVEEDDDEAAGEKNNNFVFPKVGKLATRRHSFNVVMDAPKPFQILSRKRLEMDVNLRMAAWMLRQREKKLVEMVEALQAVHKSYDEAISLLEPHVLEKQARLDQLSLTAQSLLFQSSAHLDSKSPLSALSTGSNRLRYAQKVLEDKLSDVKEFKDQVELKLVGGRGTERVTLRKQLEKLEKERDGMHKFVQVFGELRRWLVTIKGRFQWHLWMRWWSKDQTKKN